MGLGEMAMSEGLAEVEGLATPESRGGSGASAGVELRLGRRCGRARGVRQSMTQTRGRHLAAALHMLRALKLALPAARSRPDSAAGSVNRSAHVPAALGTKCDVLLRPGSCRCILAVVALVLDSAASGGEDGEGAGKLHADGVLGWGTGEMGEWLARLVPSMWHVSPWQTLSLLSRAAALAVGALARPGGRAESVALGLATTCAGVLRPLLSEDLPDDPDRAHSAVLSAARLEANCGEVNLFAGSGGALAGPGSAVAPTDLGGVVQDLAAMAALHRFWASEAGPASSVAARQEQRRASAGELTFDTLRLDLSDAQAEHVVAVTNPPGAPDDYLERPAAFAARACGVSAVVMWRRWRALGVLEHVVPLVHEISLVLARTLSKGMRAAVSQFVASELVPLVQRRVAVMVAVNRVRAWEYDKIERGIGLVVAVLGMPSPQLDALGPELTAAVLRGLDQLCIALKNAMHQLTMRGGAAGGAGGEREHRVAAREARDVCDRIEALVEEVIMEAEAQDANTLHQRLQPLMDVIDHFS